MAIYMSKFSELQEKIAGEITLSNQPGSTMRKWREEFNVSQQELSKFLGLSPSVISDYESGRRRSPGVGTVKKVVEALLAIDEQNGGRVLKKYTMYSRSEAILSMKEFPTGLSSIDFIRAINGKNVTEIDPKGDVHGFTVIDSIKAIVTFDSTDYLKIYGWSSHRALIFAGIQYGRSPMIAIRSHPLKPAMVVYHKPERIDDLATKLAHLENLPLIISELPLQKLIKTLESL
jgi:putative transcriptional regulator